ncbi:MAG: MFS transporter [Pseudomonadota bacterium]
MGDTGRSDGVRMEKPRQSWAGLAMISLGFFGIQIGFALQNANMSRIFQTLGTSLDDLPALWVAAPLTGLLVQPIVGHYSDRTWGRFGRRRPYFLAGAILAAAALLYMPLAPVLFAAAFALWILDASLNVSMEPFRAFVGDMLRGDQHTAGYAVQTAFIGAGAVAGSAFPWLLDALGVSNIAAPGHIPDTVRYSFWFGGAALLAAVLGTVFSTREYSPDELRVFAGAESATGPDAGDELTIRTLAARSYLSSSLWIMAGIVVALSVAPLGLEKEVYLLGGLLGGYGLASMAAIALAKSGQGSSALTHIVGDFSGMPPVMKQLSVAQFFSWSALFIMWINTTPVVAQYFFHTTDPASPQFNDAGNWVGIMFAVYNGVAAIAALTLLPWLAGRYGKAKTHMLCLLAGALGYSSFFVITDPIWLLLSEIGVGIAWASILAMPYSILASALPQAKLGIYMGLFNIFIVIPQLLVATVMGSIVKAYFPTQPIYTMAFAAGVMAIAAIAMLRVREV